MIGQFIYLGEISVLWHLNEKAPIKAYNNPTPQKSHHK